MVGGSRAARDLAGPRRACGPGGRKAWAGVERGAPRRDARDVAGPRVRPRAVPRLGRARRPHLQPPLRARPGRRGGVSTGVCERVCIFFRGPASFRLPCPLLFYFSLLGGAFEPVFLSTLLVCGWCCVCTHTQWAGPARVTPSPLDLSVNLDSQLPPIDAVVRRPLR
jgi:hypothetical protein